MASPLVTVIIPTRDRRALLRRALFSALAQHHVDVEVLVVDEASADGTSELVHDLADSRVELIRHETPLGVSAARNAGLERARAPWVAFLDDDDLWAPTKLAAQLEAAARSGAHWVGVGAVTVNDALTIVAGKVPPRDGDLAQLLAFNIVPGGGSGIVVRTELARALGGFDPRLGILADWDMWIRLLLETLPAFVHHPLVAYLRHSASMSHLNDGLIRELDRIAMKHQGVRQLCGVDFGRDRWLLWAAAMHVRSRHRREAVRTYAHVARRYRDLQSVARAVLGTVFPKFMIRYWSRNSISGLPDGWCAEAEAWLAPIRLEAGLASGSLQQWSLFGAPDKTLEHADWPPVGSDAQPTLPT